MKREERNEYNYIRRNLREMISSYDSTGEKPYGNTLTIRTDAGNEYKKALHTLYTFYGFHPAGITEDAVRYDGKERIVYIYGQYIEREDGTVYSWKELYTQEERNRYSAALTDEWEAYKASEIVSEVEEVAEEEAETEIEAEAEKKLYMVTSDSTLFFVCSDLDPDEIESAYLTELNSKVSPKNWYNVVETTLDDINCIRYGSQPVCGLKRIDKPGYTWITHVIRSGGRYTVTQSDLV